MRHNLKTWPEYFQAVVDGKKTFEIRKNDRGFQVGDELLLQEYDPKEEAYTGRQAIAVVRYMTDFGQQDGYVVMAIEVKAWQGVA
jgi:ASC-1-like (ASCH) protein